MRRGNERQKFIDDTAQALFAAHVVAGQGQISGASNVREIGAIVYRNAALLWNAREGFQLMERSQAAAAKRRAAEEKT